MRGDEPDAEASGSGDLRCERLQPKRTTHPDVVYDALNHRRRREICRLLHEHGERGVDDLAMDVARVEVDADDRAVTNYEWEAVYAALYHAHVPKLAELDVVEFDAAEETVSPGDRFDAVNAALRAVERELDPGRENSAGDDG